MNGRFSPCASLALALLLATVSGHAADGSERIDCGACADWNAPTAPFLLAPRTWYVGSRGLAAVLIDSGEGLILLDGGLPQSAGPIATRIRQLGFDLRQLRWILVSHAHWDHAGGIAALQRWSGAEVIASPGNAAALRLGMTTADDPQHEGEASTRFPPVEDVREIADGERLTLGAFTLTAHLIPGHAPGSTAWTWPACDARGDCVDVAYVDSLTAVSTDAYRFSDHPDRIQQFQRSIARVAQLPCDLLVTPHPDAAQLFERRAADTLAQAGVCQAYAGAAARRLDERLARERAGG